MSREFGGEERVGPWPQERVPSPQKADRDEEAWLFYPQMTTPQEMLGLIAGKHK